MKFVCYTSWEQLPESADTLFEQGEKDNLFYSRPWFENLATTLDSDQSMLMACVADDNKLLAILPLIKDACDNCHAFKHRYTTHYSLLLADNQQEQILACLAQGLSNLPLRGLILEPVAGDDNKIAGFQQQMEVAGYRCELLFRSYNWIYRVQGKSFNDYMAERPSRLRNTIARKSRKLEREHGYDIRLYTGNDVPQAMADYYAVYTASWKANEQYTSFLNGIVEHFSIPDWSRLAVLYVSDKPVAAQLWFVLHGKASIFRLSYDETWKTYSPGSILTSFLMEYVIDTDKVDEIDFLTGNDSYKQDWMSERRERFALSCANKEKPKSHFKRLGDSLKRILTQQ